MNITIQISDETYKSLLSAGNTRVPGTIALSSPTEGNFNAWGTRRPHPDQRMYIKLPHGRASVGQDDIRLSLCVRLGESLPQSPGATIVSESVRAGAFIERSLS